MAAQVTSAFLYVNDVVRSYEFYHEIVGAKIHQIHQETEGGPISLAILRLGGFTLMIHPQDEHAADFINNKPGVGLRLQLRVDDIFGFYRNCIDEGAMLALLAVHGEQGDQTGVIHLRELTLKDPDGYVWSINEDKTDGVTGAFLYVNDVVRSYEFYHEIVGAEIVRIDPETEEAPIARAILRLGGFTLTIHPQDEHAADFVNNKPGVGIHLQLRVDDIDGFYQNCLDEGAMLAVSGEPVDQPWGWREFALKDPDGYVWSIYEDKTGGQWT